MAFNEFAVYFTNNRILFTEANCRLIEELRTSRRMRTMISRHTTSSLMQGRRCAKATACNRGGRLTGQ